MNDEQLLRYSRHILLPEIDVAGQQAIIDSTALVIGVGGLGSPAALYLASAGVGNIILADGDTVDLSNLQRQILHREDRAGMSKVESGQQTLAGINSTTRVQLIPHRLEGELLEQAVSQATVVLDCCDNFATRHAINRACLRHRKPLVSGAAVRFDGQVSVYDLRDVDNACYHCVFPEGEDVAEMRCAVTGIFAPLTGIVGALQAAEALKILAGCGEPLVGRLLLIEALGMSMRTVRYSRDPDCAVCGKLGASV
ncbi:MAG: molybdopterin-synthase adenylyltransferase MoeB [Uliginosibacterium sp.]|nr:molybdopterin-synthase adenylyltransferase MoeB [Uliginosibacterium sp.]